MKHSGVIPISRELSQKERTLVTRLLQSGVANEASFLLQLPYLQVVSQCSCGCPTVDFAVSGRATAITSESTIIGEGSGVSPEGVRFGIILHSRAGLISELEVYPLLGSGAFTLPEIDKIEINDN